MNKVGKAILIVVASLIVLAALAILFVNLYVQSARTQARIERRLGQTLRMPLKLSRATFTPWSGLSITGITVPQIGMSNAPNFLEASRFAAHLQFGPLLRRQLVIDRIAVADPTVVWYQNEKGNWALPAEAKEAAPAATAEVIHEPKQPQLRPFDIVVHQLRISHGSFDFRDRNLARVALFSDVDVQCPTATESLASGTATSGKVSIQDVVFAQNLKTPFSYAAPGDLSLSELSTTIAGGEVTGNFSVKTAESGSPYLGRITFTGVDLNRLIVEARGAADQAAGTVKGYLELQGNTRDSKTAKGSGQIIVANGQLKQYDFLQMLGQALQIEELVQLNLQQAQTDFRVDDGKVWVDQLFLQSQNLSLTAHGIVRLDGKLQLKARLAVNQKISRQLPSFVATNFVPAENDTRCLDFEVTGTISKPRTNIVQRMLGTQIEKQAVDLFQNIFGGKKKDKKKPKDQPTPLPSPAQTPAPPAPGATPGSTP